MNPRIAELIQRLMSPGSIAGKLSASEFHELVSHIERVDEDLGSLHDTCENLLAAGVLPLPDSGHVQGLRGGLERIRSKVLELRS